MNQPTTQYNVATKADEDAELADLDRCINLLVQWGHHEIESDPELDKCTNYLPLWKYGDLQPTQYIGPAEPSAHYPQFDIGVDAVGNGYITSTQYFSAPRPELPDNFMGYASEDTDEYDDLDECPGLECGTCGWREGTDITKACHESECK